MPLGTEVGLGPGHIVLDAPLPKKETQPQFSAHVYCAETAGWIKMPLFTWGPSSPSQKGDSPSFFGPCLLLSPNGRPSQLLVSTC